MYKWLHTVLCIFAVTPHAGVRIEIDCIAPECWNTLGLSRLRCWNIGGGFFAFRYRVTLISGLRILLL